MNVFSRGVVHRYINSKLSQDTTKADVWRLTTTLSRARSLETVAQRAEVFCGSGFLTVATNHLGLRGHVPDTKFGPECGVTQPLVLTRIRQHVSAGNCVAGMISSCSPKVIAASADIANVFIPRLPSASFESTPAVQN